jgi:hypothetical protein
MPTNEGRWANQQLGMAWALRLIVSFAVRGTVGLKVLRSPPPLPDCPGARWEEEYARSTLYVEWKMEIPANHEIGGMRWQTCPLVPRRSLRGGGTRRFSS